MALLFNRVSMSTATTGTGTITLGSAESGFQSFAAAGVSDADVVRYVITEGTSWEIGQGTYTSTGTTLTRTVLESSNAGSAITLAGSAVVFIDAAAVDVANKIPVVQVFTSSGTYTPTTNAIAASVIVTGGGAGAGDTGSTSISGGAGGTSIKMIDLSGITTSTITIGAGGQGNTTTGNAGSLSSYADGTDTLTGNGGNITGIGGTATGGDINIKGGAGGPSGSGSFNNAPSGGASYWGSGGINSTDQGAFGGGGAVKANNGTGGDGGNGVVHITEYF